MSGISSSSEGSWRAFGLAHQRQLGPAARAHQRHLLRRADAGHHVLALGVDQELAVEQVFAGAGVAREGHAGGAAVAQVAEHHGLHVDRRAPGLRDVVELAVDLGALVVPALEHRHHGAPELLPGVGGEVAPDARADQALEALHQLLQVGGVELGVELHALLFLDHVDDHLEGVVLFLGHGLEAHHHVAVHLHEAAVESQAKRSLPALRARPARPRRSGPG
jgi:hypothetical protein